MVRQEGGPEADKKATRWRRRKHSRMHIPSRAIRLPSPLVHTEPTTALTLKLLMWNKSLTSLTLYPLELANSPFAPRKSGILAAVDTPAPVCQPPSSNSRLDSPHTTTIRFAPRIRRTTVSRSGASSSSSSAGSAKRDHDDVDGPASGSEDWEEEGVVERDDVEEAGVDEEAEGVEGGREVGRRTRVVGIASSSVRAASRVRALERVRVPAEGWSSGQDAMLYGDGDGDEGMEWYGR